jgi:hypothetical protein
MGKIIAILWIGAILFGGFWFGYYQEGANSDITIEMDVKMSVRGAPFRMDFDKLYASGGKLALDFDFSSRQFNSRGRIIIDTVKKKQIIMFDAVRAYAETSFDLVDKSECEPAKTMFLMSEEDTERLPDSKTIAGYRCHAFTGKEGGREVARGWFTYQIRLGRSHVALVNKLIRMKSDEASLFEGASSEEKRQQYSGFDYFPFPLSARLRMEEGQLAIEVKSISRDKIEKSVFEVPSGYEEIGSEEMQKRMIRGMSGGGGS